MSKDQVIRFRAEMALKQKLKARAKRLHTDYSEMLRQMAWGLVADEPEPINSPPDSEIEELRRRTVGRNVRRGVGPKAEKNAPSPRR